MSRSIRAFAVAGLLVGAFVSAADASGADSACARKCNPWTALALGIVVPGGGQFYLHDWRGGVAAVVSDALIFGALARSEASGGEIVAFIGSMHVLGGLFAAQACRAQKPKRAAAESLDAPRPPAAMDAADLRADLIGRNDARRRKDRALVVARLGFPLR